jgi:ABC-type sugar transport system substrate-binding protein
MLSTIRVSGRRFISIICCGTILLMLLTGSSCGNKTSSKPEEHILYVTLTLGNPFYQEMIGGLRDGIGTEDVKLDTMAGARTDDASGQRDIMETFLARHKNGEIKLRGLVIVPANSLLELTDTIRRYNDANIPVINVDIPIEQTALDHSGARTSAFVGSDNVEGGKKAADVMAAALPNGGNILLLLGAPGSANTKARRDGFTSRLAELGQSKGISFQVKEWTANWNMSEAVTATDSMLTGGSSPKGIFAENDLMALGAAQAVETAKFGTRQPPVIVGYDAIPDAVKAVKEGRIHATISQNPASMGKKAVEYLRQISKGEAVPSREIIPVSPVTR